MNKEGGPLAALLRAIGVALGSTLADKQGTGLHHSKHCDAHAGMENVKQEIFSVDAANVALVGVSPALRPRIYKLKRIPAVLKLPLI